MTGPTPDRRGRRLRVVTAALACAVLLGGCSSGASGSTSTAGDRPTDRRTLEVTLAPEPPGIRLSFIQQRFDEGTARAAITMMNYSGHPMRVRRVGLDWPGYPGGPQRRPYVVPSGFTVDLRYRLPVPRCGGDPFRTAPIGVAVTGSRTVRRPIDAQGLRFLRRTWAMDCNERLLARTVRLEYDGPWRHGRRGREPALVGSLRLQRLSGGAPVALTEIQGSPIFALSLGRPRLLRPSARAVSVPLFVTSGHRCDPHSRAAVTTPFTFRLWATIAGEPVTVIAVPRERVQVRMLAFLDRACAEETGQ